MARKHKFEKHHRRCRSNGGGDELTNISVVKHKHHKAWHQLFGNDSTKEIARKLTEIWIDPDFYMVAVPRQKRKPVIIKDGDIRIIVRVFDKGSRKYVRFRGDLKRKGVKHYKE